jgi:hypothetical protein
MQEGFDLYVFPTGGIELPRRALFGSTIQRSNVVIHYPLFTFVRQGSYF